MKLTKTLFILFILANSLTVGAQSQFDFIQYNMHQLYTNPAQTGAYEGTYRVGGIYRSQWNAGASATYHPTTLFVDAPLLLIAKRHWVGAGVQFAQDVAGTHNLGTKIVALSGAFHYAMDKRYRNVLTLGVQFGGGSFGLSPDGLSLNTYKEISTGINDNKTYPRINFSDMNVGLLLKSTLDKKSSLELGFAFNNLLGAKKSLLNSTTKESKNPFYFATTAGYNRKISAKGSIHPSVLVQKQTGSFTVKPQILYGHKMAKKGSAEPIILKGGLGYALNGNQAHLILGADYKTIRVGVGYGLNTGLLKDVSDNSIEIAVQYTGKIFKAPKVKPLLVCPKY